jgi:hypothetical protein
LRHFFRWSPGINNPKAVRLGLRHRKKSGAHALMEIQFLALESVFAALVLRDVALPLRRAR